MPKLSGRESIIGQGLDVLDGLIEARTPGYGYDVKEGKIDLVVEALRRGDGRLTPANAAGFEAYEGGLSAGIFHSAVAIKGQIEGPITLSAYLFHRGRPVDEPALCLEVETGSAVSEERRLTALAAVLDGARLRGAYAGLHCCAGRPLSPMCRANPHIMSFGAHEGLERP